ncbi:MAG: PilZ domain-containing protein [Terriglobia bacterium]
MLEARQSERYPLTLPAQVRWKARGKGVGRAQGKIGDISSSGLLVVIPNPLPLGTTINVTINLPIELTKVPVELSFLGRVVRKSRLGKDQGISAIIEDFQLRPARKKAAKT